MIIIVLEKTSPLNQIPLEETTIFFFCDFGKKRMKWTSEIKIIIKLKKNNFHK